MKTNIGHTETVSGLAGLIKVALMLHHGEMPQHLHFTEPNAAVNFDKLNIGVPQDLQDLSLSPQREITYASVSAFGLGGSNVHTILSTAPTSSSFASKPSLNFTSHIFLLSAKNELALKELAKQYLNLCETRANLS